MLRLTASRRVSGKHLTSDGYTAVFLRLLDTVFVSMSGFGYQPLSCASGTIQSRFQPPVMDILNKNTRTTEYLELQKRTCSAQTSNKLKLFDFLFGFRSSLGACNAY